jgi:hypothetical protein
VDLAFALGERGLRIVAGPSGPGGHRLTGSGFDTIAYDPRTREVWLMDNKASGSLDKAAGEKATALGKNLMKSLKQAIDIVRSMRAFPDKAIVASQLQDALDAVRNGLPLPSGVKLKVTNAGGYAGGARNLPKGVEYMDVVGPAPRAARAKDVAAAEAQGVKPGRPRSHAETEAMRQRVGGVQTREPIRSTVRMKVARKVRVAGGGLARVGAILLWNSFMTRVEHAIEAKFTQYLFEHKMEDLEPTIAARLDDQHDVLVELQLSEPGKPLYGNISVLTTIYRIPDEGEEPMVGLDVTLTSIKVSHEKIERTEQSRVEKGNIFWGRAHDDLLRSTYSVALEPLTTDQLREILRERVADEESSVAETSSTQEQLVDSQRRRDRIVDQLRSLGGL